MRQEFSGRRMIVPFLGIVLVVVGFWYMAGARTISIQKDNLVDVGPKTLEQMAAMGKPGVVLLYKEDCGDCLRVAANLTQLQKTYGSDAFFVKIDGERYEEELAKYQSHEFPALIYFSSSGSLRAVVQGYKRQADILGTMKELGLIK